MGWSELGDQDEYDNVGDKHVELMSNVLRDFFEKNRNDVYYSRELAVNFEKVTLEHGVYRPHHWVTVNALRKLEQEGFASAYRGSYSHGEVVFYCHKSYRYPKRRMKRKIDLINRYSDPATCKAYGEHAEQLFELALMKRRFEFVAEDLNEIGNKKWTETDHDLDFAVEKDGITYGAEVKNTLDYIDRDELDIKLEMCAFLRIKPLFIMRNASTLYIDEIVRSGGFAMIFEYQIYPPALAKLVEEIRADTLLPVMVSSAIPDGIIDRFVGWHSRRSK